MEVLLVVEVVLVVEVLLVVEVVLVVVVAMVVNAAVVLGAALDRAVLVADPEVVPWPAFTERHKHSLRARTHWSRGRIIQAFFNHCH